ncbi:MAG TPA: FecR domain-containing protein [Pyrinomonadaceae bacterium]|nr:FecR domain-containing protein [Pyrinomonadaceae bacterium]
MKISKFAMKLSALTIVLVTFAFTAEAQNRERFGISARAGGVNAVSGQVLVKRGGASEQLLTSQDDLNSGDIVTTGRDSQTEVLLNPGTYLRLSEKSEFVLVDNSLDNLLVKLTNGSAIIEATGPDNLELHIPIVTDQQRMTIVRSGIYRINVSAGVTELLVRKGRVRLGDDPKNIVKSGKKISFAATAPLTAKLTKLDRDEFDDWSRARGQTLTRANERLSARTLNGYLSSDSWSFSAAFGRWGLWTWSPFASCYTFLPFYYGWSSPYGRYYGLYAGFDPYFYPRNYNGPVIVSNPSSTPGGSTGSPTGGLGTQPGGGVISSPSSPRPGSQAGPRDPDSGTRSINRIKDPN